MRWILLLCFLFPVAPFVNAQEERFDVIEPVANLPKEYSDYLVAPATLSHDKNYAIIIPKVDLCGEDAKSASPSDRCHDYLIRVDPFEILTTLETKWPEFESKSNGGISADWRPDGSAALVTLESKWGPGDIFLIEMANTKVTRTTNLIAKAHDLLLPDYQAAKAAPYNDVFAFIFLTGDENDLCEFIDATHVRVAGDATNNPKGPAAGKVWKAHLEAVWDIPSAKFVSQKITRKGSSGKGKKK